MREHHGAKSPVHGLPSIDPMTLGKELASGALCLVSSKKRELESMVTKAPLTLHSEILVGNKTAWQGCCGEWLSGWQPV